ncbi:MAG: hypothetical protein JKY70_17795 [Mucilaginibacter sp.]|nr:hypothetical protein [Mucilaginibacter sp.]
MTTNRSLIVDTYPTTERFIVVLGASAGGLEAIHDFFDHMPANTGFTFVVIQHLSPDHKSLLVELVGKHTHMKVMEAVNGTLLEKNCVYIIPSKKMMTIRHRKLRLEDKIKDRSPNTAIDTFLVTLANDVKDKAIAIILSGTGTDGSKGIEAIKQRGGLVIVQDPATAKFDAMPRSAIESGNTDFVLAPSKMKAEIYNYVKQLSMSGLEKELDNDEHLNEIFHLVSQKTGHDFNLYKTPTILRRIARRIAVVEVPDLPGYLTYIKSNPDESSMLSKEFLIGVTKFFRDQAAFDEVRNHIIPEIIRSKNDGETIKIWVCACSTGEEAYSLAINFHEQILVSGKDLDLKVFATDLDEGSIKIASKNHYPATAVRDINAGTLQKYFTKNSDGTFSINQDIRKKVVFAAHNVIKSPPFIKNDMISCRNMLIYMNAVLQQKVLSTFHYSLCPSGFLFLGQSENASSLKDGLVEISNKFKLYQRNGNIKYELPKGHTTSSLTPQARPGTPVKETQVQNTFEQELLRLLTGRLAYVGVFIDKNFTIRETLGDFTKYLSLPQKRLELNLLNMVSREVSILLSTTVRKSWKDNEIKSFTGINDDQDADGK